MTAATAPTTGRVDTADLEGLLLDLLAAPSPNPPGDVTAVTEVVTDYLAEAALPFRVHSTAAGRRNVVVEVLRSDHGRHLVWNGHLDVFPAAGDFPVPRSVAGRVHGRGAVDMKGGVAAFLVAARHLRQHGTALRGSLSLTLVCDEETFGPLGARSLLRREPELLGDAMVSTEPSSLGLVRIAERAFLWVRVTFLGISGHSAYPARTEGVVLRISEFVLRVRDLVAELNRELDQTDPVDVDEAVERHLGPGTSRLARRIGLNVGTVQAGRAINLQPDEGEVTLDLRVPVSVDPADLVERLTAEAERWGGSLEVVNSSRATATPGDAAIVTAVVDAVEAATGARPALSTGLGCTDTRLWRYAGVPACVIGPNPATRGAADEHVDLAELRALVEILVRSAETYLGETS